MPLSARRLASSRVLAPALALFVLMGSSSRAADIHVDGQSGRDAHDGASWASAKKTVSAALAQALLVPGPDTVLVARGRHVGQFQVPPETILLGGFPSGGAGPREWRANPTILDGRGAGPVVSFGPGTDASAMDGFVIEGGRATLATEAGGVTIRGSAARLESCSIERNEGLSAGGILVDARGLVMMPMITRCVIRANVATGGAGAGAGGLALTDDDAPLSEPLIHGSLIDRNVVRGLASNPGIAAGGVYVRGQAHVGHAHVRGNTPSGVVLDSNPGSAGGMLMNSEISGSPSDGLVVGCGATSVMVDNCTLVDNGGAAMAAVALRAPAGGDWHPHVERSILWRNGVRGLTSSAGCMVMGAMVRDSVVDGGFASGMNVLDVDPLLVKGPAMSYYLASRATGHPADSVAIDAGPALSSDLGLGPFTTQTNSGLDLGAVDWGAHCEPSDGFVVARADNPMALGFHASVEMLPFSDVGALHDPGLPLLYYDIQWAWGDIHVVKEESSAAVLIAF